MGGGAECFARQNIADQISVFFPQDGRARGYRKVVLSPFLFISFSPSQTMINPHGASQTEMLKKRRSQCKFPQFPRFSPRKFHDIQICKRKGRILRNVEQGRDCFVQKTFLLLRGPTIPLHSPLTPPLDIAMCLILRIAAPLAAIIYTVASTTTSAPPVTVFSARGPSTILSSHTFASTALPRFTYGS